MLLKSRTGIRATVSHVLGSRASEPCGFQEKTKPKYHKQTKEKLKP